MTYMVSPFQLLAHQKSKSTIKSAHDVFVIIQIFASVYNNFPSLHLRIILLSLSMEIFHSFPSNTIPTITVAFLIICTFLWISRKAFIKKKKTAPEAGGAWPVIGHLHLLGGREPAHIVLGKMADKYGPVFTIKMGVHRTLIVSNWEMAKECFTTNDKAFAYRPHTLAMKHMAYDGSMLGFSQYGNYWRQMRKIATLELLSNHRLEQMKHIRESEMRTALKELYKLWDKNKSESSSKVLVEMKRWFGDISTNIILRIIIGKSVGYFSENEGKNSDEYVWKKALRDFFDLWGRFVVGDAVPFLSWLDIEGISKEMKRTAKDLDIVVNEWLKEHKEKKASGSVKKGEEDFMGLMLDIIDDEAQTSLGRDSDTINKATCLAMTLAASDTTAVTSVWALSLLVNNPHVLKKAQEELDIHVGKERQVGDSDLNNLVYLKAIIKETMRLYPAGPLSVPHESREDCIVGGYHIPAGTRLLTNIWKIHRDPRVWPNPLEFEPEKFITSHKDFDFRGQNFEFIPFGSGRRMCPGVSFALQVVQLALATLLQGFDFEAPTNEPIDMTESLGLTNLKETPLDVLINPRLKSHLYIAN